MNARSKIGNPVACVEPLESRQLLSAALYAGIHYAAAQQASSAHAVTKAVTTPPVLDVQNADFLPFSDRMIFNTIKYRNRKVGDTVHDIGTLVLTNRGGSALTINSLVISKGAPWVLWNAPKTPFTLAAGKSMNLKVKFAATANSSHAANQTNDVRPTDPTISSLHAGGVWYGTLTINTNAPATPATVISLAGYWQHETEHEEEPSLQTILNLVGGWKTDVSDTVKPNYPNNGSTVVYYGDEVHNAAFWQAADPSKPVVVRQVAAFHNELDSNGNLTAATIFWHLKGKTTNYKIFSQATDESQSFLPHLKGSLTQYAAGTFKPGTSTFGWFVDGEYSQDSRNTGAINTYHRSGHDVRFYPVLDRAGNVEPNNYFIGLEYGNTQYANADYQDAVYYVENMKPST